ncbi:DUF2933 domain-containing protein [Streptomyces sp. CdTB01]|uniref:DUF2933 domain-containing protein n=1 Tax=Streptomyces sp. CdTB01 TaxID=1725411 RepID=UPI00073A5A2D|nr:DUF2933 domain-containing protein [Streptomyces sp. CdTB01]ALV33169.1 hypothetical protein AS200_14810 [Streptomyces sp. CdTB01]
MKPKLLIGILIAVAAAALLLRLGVPPLTLVLIALVAACPLSMAFMHGGHGGHGGHSGHEGHSGGPYGREDETRTAHDHVGHETKLTKKSPPHH